MADFVNSNISSPHWAALIAYLCIYISGLIGVTITGWALYHAKPKSSSPHSNNHQPRYNVNGLSASGSDNTSKNTSTTTDEKQEKEQPLNGSNNQHQHNEEEAVQSIAWSKYFILWKQKSWILLSLFMHIIIQGFNFAVMVEFISLGINQKYSFDPNKIDKSDLMEICIISLLSFILYRFGSAILIWRLSHSVRKSTFQIIDITILYQLLKGYKKKTRNNPGRIVQYINYLNAMFQSCAQATVQLVFLMKTRIIGDSEATKQYPFIYIILFAFILNVRCVVMAVYEKDLLLTSDTYRKHKTIQQISTHVVFRFVDISLRIIILAMLWLTIGFGGVFAIVLCEFLILSYLAYYTKQTYRLQEMVAVILHISNFAAEISEDDKLRPLTPATIRMKNQLQVQLNVDVEEIEKREDERKREIVRECQCFKWRILCNIIYIIIFASMAEIKKCLICPDYEDRSYVTIGSTFGIILTVYCGVTAALYPFIYWILSASNRWSKTASSGQYQDDDDIFGYLERSDFESAKEILDFGKKIDIKEYIEWAESKDFSTENDPNQLIKFLYQQKVKINSIYNKSQGGLNILHQICKNPEIENASVTVKFLIKLGFDIRSKTQKTEDTPFHIACQYCNKSVLTALLSNGNGSDELFLKNKAQQTPFHSLMTGYNKKYHKNQIEMTQMMFNKYNAEQVVLEFDIYGKSPLHIACVNKDCPKEIIKLLLENGAYPYQADNDDYYPKDYVSDWDDKERKDVNIVMKWLKEGLKGDQNGNERTPLKSKVPNRLNAPKKSNYIELSEETGSGGNQTPITVTTHSNNDHIDDGKEEEEDEDAEARRLYGDDSDDDIASDNDGGIDPTQMITPITPNPQTTLDTPMNIMNNVTPKPLELINSAEVDSDEEMVVNEEEMQ